VLKVGFKKELAVFGEQSTYREDYPLKSRQIKNPAQMTIAAFSLR